MNDRVKKAVELIKAIYETENGGAGGYGHIVFDDGNIETENIEYCIESAEKGEYKLSEECRIASIKALKYFLELNEDERLAAMENFNNISETKEAV